MNYTKAILMICALPLVAVLYWQEGACQQKKSGGGAAEKMSDVRHGRWGGRGVIMDVTGDGAIVEYDCGSGTISGPILLDKDGRFEAKGSHVTERPGPVRVGRESGAQPASYTGRVDAETMTLTVRLTETGETVGTYTLGYGKASRLRKCL